MHREFKCGARVWVIAMLAGFVTIAAAQTPEWIWAGPKSDTSEAVFFRKTFRTPPLLWNSRLTMAADDSAEVFLNGISIATCSGPEDPVRAEVTVRLNQGENVIAVRAVNRRGPAGLLVSLNLGGQTNLVSDSSWLVSTNEERNWTSLSFNAANWSRATTVASHGAGVWGDVLSRGSATPASSISVLPGFRVELIRSARANEGSWICLAVDPKGRLVISPQGDDRPLLRMEVTNGTVGLVDTISAPVRYAMGLLYAHGSLYANARGPSGAGLYRLTDANADDQFDSNEMQLLKRFEGGSEHGYHGLAQGPEGKIYVMNGNGTKLASGLSNRSPYRNFAEDVLSLNPDEGAKSPTPAPAGHVLRTDAAGQQWELWLGGLRNAFDFDFNSDGELFTFDSDMEWDWGTPWYRPTRIVHAVPGGEYGWRDGTRLWPEYYADSLPGAVDVGIGSPTGVKFGTKSRFPEAYQRALFALDWSYGRILAVHLEPSGATYRGRMETFLSGAPLNVTDVEFGTDGAMYFITGGRGTQSGLYRVIHSDPGNVAVRRAPAGDRIAEEARQTRRQLERFHIVQDSAGVAMAWPHLSSEDRFVRHAARVALEAQDLSLWRDRALSETNVTAGLTALLALARVGGAESQNALLKALARFPLDSLDESHTLLKLRVIQLSIVRHGIEPPMARLAMEKLDRKYPSPSWQVNRELSRLLIRLEAPGVIAKTLNLLESAPSQEEQLHYVSQLRNLRTGWTRPERERFFSWWLKPRNPAGHAGELRKWFGDVGRTYVDGAWVDKYLREFRADAIASLTAEERTQLGPLLAQPITRAQLLPSSQRSFVRDWTMSELVPELQRAETRRNFERGRQAFVDAQCLACHRFGNDGAALGPELTGAGSKYDLRSLLESILEPSKVINEQYRSTSAVLNDGETVTGRLVSDSADQVVIEVEADNVRQSIPRTRIKSIAPSETSSMPAGLLNILSKEEVLDLLAYLRSGGRANAPAFK